jgi:hypothetical protein
MQNTAKIRRLIDEARRTSDRYGNPQFVDFYAFSLEQHVDHKNRAFFDFITQLREPPVPIETFLDHENFMGSTDLELWPEVRRAIVELNKDWWKGKAHGAYTEILCMGATGTGKSEIAKVTTAYHLHILGCMKKPQVYWGLPSSTSILFPIFAAKPRVTKNILYMPLRAYIEVMPWFQLHMRFDPYIESEMVFESHNIRVVPVGADVDAVLGEALPGGIIDEINFMQVVEHSKKAEAKTGRASRYDQSEDIFNKVTRRKTSRFTRPGPNVGVLCTLSSTSHPGEFTERRQKEVARENLKHVYIYNKAQYEVQPPSRYCGDKFYVCIHADAASTIELRDWTDVLPKEADIYEVPIELRDDFVRDPEGATRDIIGRSTRSLSPFITKRSAIHEAVDLWRQGNHPDIVEHMNTVTEYGLPRINPNAYCKNPSKPRYVHIDLSSTGDRCGIAMLRYDGVAEMTRSNGVVERLPTGVIELAISIEPDLKDPIDIAEVRAWVRKLKTEYGYPIRVVSYDGWNSLESRQQWKKQGISSLIVSVDKTEVPYHNLRDALYDGRLALPPNEILIEELFRLEEDKEKKKIDHPSDFSKDIADAVCGAYHTMLNRSSTWRSEEIDNPRGLGLGRYEGDRAELGVRY